MVTVKEVTSPRMMKAFVSFPLKLYEGNPYYVPQFFKDEYNLYFPKKSIHGDVSKSKFFIAYKDKKPVGRICAKIVYPYNEKTGRKVCRFSRFDLIDDAEVAQALFAAAEAFAKGEGMDELQGPMGYADTDREGLLIFGFDKLSTYTENYSFEYYVKHVEANGFQKEVDWVEFLVQLPKERDERIARLSQMVAKRYDLIEIANKEQLSMNQIIKQYGQKIFQMYNVAYADLHGTIPLSPKVIDDTIKMFRVFLRPDFVSVIVDKEDNVVGFGAVIPSISKELIRNRGKLGLFAILRLLKIRKNPEFVEFALIGTLPEYQKRGVAAMVIDKIQRGLLPLGITYAETNLELETNTAVISLWKDFDKELIKRRRCYIKKI